jgi:hypothetical protein
MVGLWMRACMSAGGRGLRHAQVWLSFRERRFATQLIRRMLSAHGEVRAAMPELSGKGLYREILLRTQRADSAGVDQILRQAEDSIDEWTAPGRDALGFREVVHFCVMSQYQAAGHMGTRVSVKKLVDALIPADL